MKDYENMPVHIKITKRSKMTKTAATVLSNNACQPTIRAQSVRLELPRHLFFQQKCVAILKIKLLLVVLVSKSG